MKKTEKKSHQTRKALLDAALEVFYEKGVEKATLSAIAIKAGMTRGALYWHFENKQQILEQICAGFIEEDLQELQQVLKEEKVWQALAETLKTHFHTMVTSRRIQQFTSIMFCQGGGAKHNSDMIGKLFSIHFEMWTQHVGNILSTAQERGEIAAETDLTWARIHLQATCMGLLKMLFGPMHFEECSLYINPIIDATMQLIARPPQITTSNL